MRISNKLKDKIQKAVIEIFPAELIIRNSSRHVLAKGIFDKNREEVSMTIRKSGVASNALLTSIKDKTLYMHLSVSTGVGDIILTSTLMQKGGTLFIYMNIVQPSSKEKV